MQQGIVVFRPGDLKRAVSKASGKPCTWVYLGEDVRRREQLSETLGRHNCYFVGRLLHEIAHQYRQPVLDFIAELGLLQKSDRNWWASNTSYQHPEADDLFLLWCYTVVFEVVRTEHEKDNLVLVCVDDPWLYRQLWEDYHRGERGGVVFLSSRFLFPSVARALLRGSVGRGRFFLKALGQVIASKLWEPKVEIIGGGTAKRKVYIHARVGPESFGARGEYVDTQYGRLSQILAKKDCEVVYVTPLFLPLGLKKKCMAAQSAEFVFLDQYLTFRDVFMSVWAMFLISWGEMHRWMKSLLQRQMLQEIGSFPQCILVRRAFSRWLNETVGDDVTVVYPFGNRPWEKMLCLAAERLNRDVRLIGYQTTPVAPMELNYFMGAGEFRRVPLPSTIVTSGEASLGQLHGPGYEGVDVVNGGALMRERPAPTPAVDPYGRSADLRMILAVVPSSRGLAEEFLTRLIEAFGHPTYRDKYRFRVLLPPDLTVKALNAFMSEWPKHFQLEDKSVSQAAAKADVVLYTSSDAGIEALLAGVPVVRYLPETGLSVDPLDLADDRIDRIIRSCSAEDLREVVQSALNEPGELIVEEFMTWAESLARFYSRVDEGVWRQAIGSWSRMKMYMRPYTQRKEDKVDIRWWRDR